MRQGAEWGAIRIWTRQQVSSHCVELASQQVSEWVRVRAAGVKMDEGEALTAWVRDERAEVLSSLK